MLKLLVYAALALSLASVALAEGRCNEAAEGSAAYKNATDLVRQLPEYQAWSRSHNFPEAFNGALDKEVLLGGKCYWSISVYADRPERLELWHVFFLHQPANEILVESIEGEPIALKEWRKQGAL
jgi:hypothetical protein